MTNYSQWQGQLGISGWHGITWYDVTVINETPKKYRITSVTDIRLAGRNRTLKAGETVLVPKYSIRESDNPIGPPEAQ